MGALIVKAEGIFLWASLAIDNLTYFSSGPDFEKFLRKLPSRLADVYGEMLRTLFSREEPGEILNMIWSVALALRPLTFDELAHILACMEEKTRAEQLPSHWGTSSNIRQRTEQEIRIYARPSLGFLQVTTETVSIVHHTAIEYLFDEYSKGCLPVLSKNEADLTISWGCFRYLHYVFGDPERLPGRSVSRRYDGSRDSSFGQDCHGEKPGETSWEVARKNPQEAAANQTYLRYAAESWFIHARYSIEISKDNFFDESARNWLQHQFFETSDAIRKPWIELCGDPEMDIPAGDQTPLHIAVCLGLVPLVEKALSDFTQETNGNWPPLHIAAKFISEAYKILIAKGRPSLLTDLDQNGNTPLHQAIISGHCSMVKALVKKFTKHKAFMKNINKKNHLGNTPLHLAFQFDHMEMVWLLVENGANTTIKNNAQLTPFELGALLGRDDNLDTVKYEVWEENTQEIVKEPIAKPPEEPLEEPVWGPIKELGWSEWAHPPRNLVCLPEIQPMSQLEPPGQWGLQPQLWPSTLPAPTSLTLLGPGR